MHMEHEMEKLVQQGQQRIVASVEALNQTRVVPETWTRPEGGGGVTCAVGEGAVFEKGGVNVSTVKGPYHEQMRQMMPVDCGQGTFFATGISLVLHAKNPFVPTVHMNYRFFCVYEHNQIVAQWFGGGIDLSPNYLFPEDVEQFHEILRQGCDSVDPTFYEVQKQDCDDYFYLPHRKEHRGVGGIFVFRQGQDQPQRYFEWARKGIDMFLPSYIPLVQARHDTPYGPRNSWWQSIRRGRYVEFNLLYDKGTKFGLISGGRSESILISMPKHASWEYGVELEQGSPEQEMEEVLQNPRTWCRSCV